MDFADSIKAHAKKVMERKAHAKTEEATKMALIVPFLQALGYDPYDPCVVIPEYCADFGNKKECKVDYAIKRGDDVVLIIEAKKVGDSLDSSKEGQLQQYFQSLLSVKIAILTDGIVYKFYTDLENANVMDKRPFMTFDFSEMNEALIPELKKLCNDCFDLDTALCAALELKYLGLLKATIAEELSDPSDDMVRFLTKKVYDSIVNARVLEEFRPRIKTAFESYLNDILNARLQGAMQPNILPKSVTESPEKEERNDRDSRIVTTEEEMEGYHIVRAILSKVVDPARVAMRDTISYFGILLDDKNTKPLCRLHFNAASVKYIELFDSDKKGTKHKIESVFEIYKFEDELRLAVGYYDDM